MWVEADEIVELFRGYLPYYLLIALPIFIIISPVCPVGASHEFPAYRMQQYDLHGVAHGCRSSVVNLEARSVAGWGSYRHCVVARLEDISIEQFREIRIKAGALIVVLPNDIRSYSVEEQQHMLALEQSILAQQVAIPVYFVNWSPEIQRVLDDLSESYLRDDKADTAAEVLVNTFSANGYQIVITTTHPVAKTDANIATIQGKLTGHGVEEKLPTIVLVAHYDSFGMAPELALGVDSNGSGVSVLLELARLFSQLYANPKTRARHNIMFLLTGAGKLNYQGSKKLLEDQLDGLESSLLQDASFVLCLDSLASAEGLYLHVSKPPKEGSAGNKFFKHLKSVAEILHPNVAVEVVHKKINLADDKLAWEHERYSIRRLPAFTISAMKSHKNPLRASIMDTGDSLERIDIVQRTEIIAEALARYIFNVSLGNIFTPSLGVAEDALSSWMEFLGSQPRSPQLLAEKLDPTVVSLRDAMSRYLKDVKVTNQTADKQDPEFVFYDITKVTVNVYSVKPAVFDLFLSCVISMYLGVICLFIQKFPVCFSLVSTYLIPSTGKSKHH